MAARASDVGGWVLRGGVAAFFVLMGAEKFPDVAGNPWVALFQQIGVGQWFRYFTGCVEIGGAILYFFPRTCLIGTAMLASAMLGAMTVQIAIRHSIAASLYPAIVLVAVLVIALRQPDDSPDAVARRVFSRRQ